VSSDAPSRVLPRSFLLDVLLLAIVVAISVSGEHLWHSHQRTSRTQAYANAERVLTTLRLPAGLNRGSNAHCVESPGVLCATSTMTGTQVDRLVADAMHTDNSCAAVSTDDCRPVLGTVAGYPAAGIVIDHFVHIRAGSPPRGAMPIGPIRNKVFTIGSYVEIQLDSPGP
jgi:hypothetical protein